MSSEQRLAPPQVDILRRVLPEGARVAQDSVESAGRRYPIEPNGIVRFRQDDGYAQSFAFQWTTYQLVQYDSKNQTNLYGQRFKRETGWDKAPGEVILEAGCGAGAFTQHILGTGASVVSIDFSTAVDVAAQHNKTDRAVFCQADILDLPFATGSFDRVFCHGVLQHTPSPEKAFHSIARVLKPGGRLSIDVYRKDFSIQTWKSKRLWRWLTTRMEHERLLAILRWYIPKWLPIDTKLKSIPYAGRYLGAVIPCWNYFQRKELTQEQLLEWAVMDTFDALAPKYDIPATLGDVRRWFRDAGFTEFEVRLGGNGVVGNGVKP